MLKSKKDLFLQNNFYLFLKSNMTIYFATTFRDNIKTIGRKCCSGKK